MKTKHCKTCEHCKQVYEKCLYVFWRTDRRYCELCCTLVEREGGCDGWQKKAKTYDLSAQRLDKAEQDIRFLIKHSDE